MKKDNRKEQPDIENSVLREEMLFELKLITESHAVLLDKLLSDKTTLSLTLCEMFEDIGNRYIDLAEQISAMHNKKPETVRHTREEAS